MLYVEPHGTGARIAFRRLGSSPAGPVTVSPVEADAPEVISWAESPPALERLPDGALLAAYTVALPGKWKAEIVTRRSADGGRSWGETGRLHPRRDGSHSFVSSVATPYGAVFAWLDNRGGKMGLHAAATPDGRLFAEIPSPDPETCQCCGTALLFGTGGNLWLVYRDLEDGDLRDFKVLRSAPESPMFDSAARLSSDGWRIQGCPETGARLAQAPDGALWAVWFTGGGVPGVYAASSKDEGATFATRTLVSEPDRLGKRPEIGVLPDGRVVVFYEALDDRREPSVYVRIRSAAGDWGPPELIASGAANPRFAVQGGRAAFAVTCRKTPETIVVREWREGEPAPSGGEGCS